MRRPFTSAGFSPDMTLGELEDELARILRGKTRVLPLEVYQELTGLRDMDDWSEAVMLDLLAAVGLDSDGDGLWSRIEKPQRTDGQPAKGLWN